jgi:WD40 repeat protein
MYRLAEIMENDGPLSMVNEVSFHPSGSYFVATYETIDEVRAYDSINRKILWILRNPEAQLDHPHGIVVTQNYLLVGNKHNLEKPGTINVYQNGRIVEKPTQVFESPFAHLREPHSLALRHGRLLISYCENVAPSGAIVSYGFDEETGKILAPSDKTEAWFSEFGDPKGICFSADGTKVWVTFESDRQLSTIRKLLHSLKTNNDLVFSTRFMRFYRRVINKVKNEILSPTLEGKTVISGSPINDIKIKRPIKNGIAMFSIDGAGKISIRPEQIFLRKKFCRLENIDVCKGMCVVTDLSNRSVLLYDLYQDPKLRNPVQTVSLGNAAPHGAKFSPDGRLLIISCSGLKIVDQEPQFFDWESPREDKIFVFERAI